MKRSPQPQQTDLFSYAASKTSTVQEEAAPEENSALKNKSVAETKVEVKFQVIPARTPPIATPAAPKPTEPESPPARPAPGGRARFARSLVVSIHDVSPLTQDVTQRVMAEMGEIGVNKIALLVVPNHHCKAYFLDHPEFCTWLREQARAGHEVVVHGYRHRRDQRPGETFRQKLATQYYTAGEGEFYDIAGADALRVISQARQEFRKIGIDTKGFVAPAWLLSEGADRALQRLGVCYTTRLGGLFDYTTGTHHHSQSLVWSTRSLWRRMVSLMWNAYLFRRLHPVPLLRISIHPPDIHYGPVWRQIKGLAAKALKDRVATTFTTYLNLK